MLKDEPDQRCIDSLTKCQRRAHILLDKSSGHEKPSPFISTIVAFVDVLIVPKMPAGTVKAESVNSSVLPSTTEQALTEEDEPKRHQHDERQADGEVVSQTRESRLCLCLIRSAAHLASFERAAEGEYGCCLQDRCRWVREGARALDVYCPLLLNEDARTRARIDDASRPVPLRLSAEFRHKAERGQCARCEEGGVEDVDGCNDSRIAGGLSPPLQDVDLCLRNLRYECARIAPCLNAGASSREQDNELSTPVENLVGSDIGERAEGLHE